MMHTTLPDTLAWAAKETKGKKLVRLIERGVSSQFGWDDLQNESLRAGAWLQGLGVKKDMRIAIIMPTSRAFLDVFFGILQIGATPVPLYPPVRLGKMEEYLKKTAAMLVAADCELLVCDPLSERVLGRLLDLHEPRLGIQAMPPISKLPERTQDKAVSRFALIQFSSGTTVEPKPVCLTHEQLLANMRQIYTYVDRQPQDMMLSWLPLYHDMGLVGAMLGTLYGAAPLILLRPEDFLAKPIAWLQAISDFGATITVAPNFAYNICAARITAEQAAKLDLSKWRIAMNGAEPVTVSTMERFAEKFAVAGFNKIAFKPVYGLSEAALAVTMSNVQKGYRTLSLSREALYDYHVAAGDDFELVSLGPAIPGLQIEIRAELKPLPERTIGRLWIKGASVMDGYYARKEQPFVDGWLDTGDDGFLDANELFLVGRSKDIIVINGKNHVPQDIEAAVDLVPDVRTGCSVAVGHTLNDGEALLLFAESYAKDRFAIAKAIESQVLADCQLRVERVVICAPGTLPRTSSGKLRRKETLRLYLKGELTPPHKVTMVRIGKMFAASRISYFKALLRKRLQKRGLISSPERA